MSAMNELLETLPKHTCSWLQNKVILYKYQDFWTFPKYLEGAILAQKSFEAKPTDVFLCSSMKTGTTWLKALAFSIVTRDKFNNSNSPLRTSLPHDCVPLLETRLNIVQDNQNSSFPLVATHLPYVSLPESVISAKCKIVYVYRNTKDVITSYYHFRREALKIPINEAPFEEAFEEFYQGLSVYGPYWDHILGYWKASIERPNHVMLLKYEDLKKDPAYNVKRLADFIGFPFSVEEEKAGVIEKIIKFCSFEHLSNLEVNKSGKTRPGSLENRLYFRKAEDGDWKNLFTDDMKQRIDELMEEKLSETGLVHSS